MQEPRAGRLAERTVDDGLAVMEYCESLPRTAAGRHVGDQLLRSATSVAANYAEASEAESTADFVHKMKVAMKELKESRVWLIFASRLAPCEAVESLRAESKELLLMVGKSINTASARMQGKIIGA
jgi:four helix bundle protein